MSDNGAPFDLAAFVKQTAIDANRVYAEGIRQGSPGDVQRRAADLSRDSALAPLVVDCLLRSLFRLAARRLS